MKTRISAPAHPSATGGRVSGLVLSHLSYFVQRNSGAAIHIAVGSQTHGPQLSRYEDMRRCVDGGLKAVLRRFKGGGSHNVADDL